MGYDPGNTCYGKPVYAHYGSPEKCHKCGNSFTRHNIAWDATLDLLCLRCKWCGYYWYEVCADYKPKAPPTPVPPLPPSIEQQAERELEAFINREDKPPHCMTAPAGRDSRGRRFLARVTMISMQSFSALRQGTGSPSLRLRPATHHRWTVNSSASFSRPSHCDHSIHFSRPQYLHRTLKSLRCPSATT